MRILVTRPHEDAAPLAERLAALGHEALPTPLLEIKNIAGDVLNLQGVQAVLFTSANGVRAFAARSHERGLAVFCVGDATAGEAAAAGFRHVKSAAGDVAALAKVVQTELDPQEGAVLHPAGSKVAGDLAGQLQKAGFKYCRAVLYRAEPVEILPEIARDVLAAGAVDGVLLYSPRTAQAFVRLVQHAGLGDRLSTVSAYCLSQAVADAAQSLHWAAVRVAARPDQDALLDLLA